MTEGEEGTKRLFVYGTLREGCYNNYLIGGARCIGTFRTATEDFTMLDAGGYPLVVNEGTDSIEGEIYEVEEERYTEIAGMEIAYGYMPQEIQVEDGSSATIFVFTRFPLKALKEDLDTIPNGDWMAAWREKAREEDRSSGEHTKGA